MVGWYITGALEKEKGRDPERECSTGEPQGRARMHTPQGKLAAAALTEGESPLTAQHNVGKYMEEMRPIEWSTSRHA